MATIFNTNDGDVELIGSRIARIDPDNFRNQSGASTDDSDKDDEVIDDEEPTDEDGDPTGEHDHQQDDNYALGGHVTRSSGE
ncbi:hypothetical protein [Spirosoma agri]|uniref:Uncharacterized protein n=1 Tax=Spirosoma agri TaxID=1987381 RepID=A0A6M0IIR2_9BACT|nr:hypothetical protein [Spirosoma agri]NEU66873.1 hypothetical protein [Spirosoma agri]